MGRRQGKQALWPSKVSPYDDCGQWVGRLTGNGADVQLYAGPDQIRDEIPRNVFGAKIDTHEADESDDGDDNHASQ